VIEDCLNFGERQRTGRAFFADAQLDLFGQREIATSILLRSAEGFGLKHHLRTDRLLTLSEDLPVVSVAVDTRPRIEALLDDLHAIERRDLLRHRR
jgi:PII-like signaling protein